MELNRRKLKVTYLHGRPSPHPMHERLAKTVVNDRIMFVDEKIRWQDKKLIFPFKLFAWIYNALFYPRNSDVYLVDGLHFSPVFFKKLFLKKNQKIAAHMGSHTLYFLKAGRFGKLNTLTNKWLLRQYDGFFCEGHMAKDLVEELLENRNLPVLKPTFLGPPSERYERMQFIQPDLAGNRILFVSNGPGEFRKYYKGVDLLVQAFNEVKKVYADAELHIVGDWDDAIVQELKSYYHHDDGLIFHGEQSDINPYLALASIYANVSRGDAFPTATLEAMASGLPVLVSEWTGTKEVVAQADPSFIVPLEKDKVAESLINYFKLPLEQRRLLSEKFREVVKSYTEEKALQHYREQFQKFVEEIENA